MIRLQFTQASAFENSFLTKQFSLPVKKRHFLIGRGQELQQKESKQNCIIILNNFSTTLSRIHAIIDFSPAWFMTDIQKAPQYLKGLKFSKFKFPPQLLEIIWSFIRPKKECVLRDLKSKYGIFKKIDKQQIQSEMIIEFVHQAFITFHHCQKYENFDQLRQRIESLKKSNQNMVVFGDLNGIKQEYDQCDNPNVKKQFLRLWQFSNKQNFYVLLIQNQLILRIGRSSHCEIQIKETAISRYQAYLKCEEQKWFIIDGNQIEKSKNGTWKKCKNIKLETSQNQIKTIKNEVKIGTIRCEIQAIQNFQWLNIVELNKDIDDSESSITDLMEQQKSYQKDQKNV